MALRLKIGRRNLSHSEVLFLLQLNGINRAQTPMVQTPTLIQINAGNPNNANQGELNAALSRTFDDANGINGRITALRTTIEQLRDKFNDICAIC